MTRVHNFCPGPCALPTSVVAELGEEMLDYRGTGMSVVEMSHRGADYEAIHHGAMDLFRSQARVPEEFAILFVQGGATLQFGMVPLNLLGPDRRAAYVLSGSWARKALADGRRVGTADVAWDGTEHDFTRMPDVAELSLGDESALAYVHVTSNETIEGIRLPDLAALGAIGAPVVADMSSDYLSRPIDWSAFDLVYGGIQKNLGPAGVAVVVVRRSLLDRTPDHVPAYLRYETHVSSDSLANTPAVFSIWAMGKMLAWMEANGGVEAMEKRAAERSGLVYDVIDASDGFYRGPAAVADRSHTNIVFNLPTPDDEQRFLADAADQQLVNLKGHRSVGGIRVSIYNGLATESVEVLTGFMRDFAARAG